MIPAAPRIVNVLLAWAGCIAASVIFCISPLAAQTPSAQEQQVKAAYLYKFGGYVEWPPEAFKEAGSPVVIAIAGDPSMAQEMEKVVGNRTVNGRSVQIREVRSVEDAGSPHILFVGRSQLSRIAAIPSLSHPVLIVTDAPNGLELGSIINFVTADNRVRFEISLDAARRKALKIAAPLLSVAMKVQ